MSDEAPPDPDAAETLDAVRALVGLRPLPDEAAELPLAKRLACAVLGLSAYERKLGTPMNVMYPDKTQAMMGELLIETGEALLAAEPQASYDPLADPPRERFLDLCRDMAKELAASAPARPRLVKPNGRPLR